MIAEDIAGLALRDDPFDRLVDEVGHGAVRRGGVRNFAHLLHDVAEVHVLLELEVEIEPVLRGIQRAEAVGDGFEKLSERAIVRLPVHHERAERHARRTLAQVHAHDVAGAEVIHDLGDGRAVGIGHGFRAELGDNRPGDERRAAVTAVERRHAVRELLLVRERMMHEHAHRDLCLIDAVAQAFEEGVVIVEARIHALDGAEHAALIVLRRVARARAGGVAVEVVEQTAAVTVVESRAGEVL